MSDVLGKIGSFPPFFVPEGLRSAFRAAANAEQAAIDRDIRDLIAATLGWPTVPVMRFHVGAKAKRRYRRAQLRRVHRGYAQRHRCRSADLSFLVFDEVSR